MDVDIILDAGHGGFDNGASYMGRAEKDDVLRLTLAVGAKLKEAGYNVYYTRTTDVYNSPTEKAALANLSGGKYFISFHRNSGMEDNLYNGVQTLVYQHNPTVDTLAENINRQLEQVGFKNLGVEEVPGLIVLRKTEMPAVLVEAGFLNSDIDNQLFDEKFDAIVDAIVAGIEESIPLSAQEIRNDIMYKPACSNMTSMPLTSWNVCRSLVSTAPFTTKNRTTVSGSANRKTWMKQFSCRTNSARRDTAP